MYDDEFEKNETKRSIKIISPQALPSILRKFEQIMSA